MFWNRHKDNDGKHGADEDAAVSVQEDIKISDDGDLTIPILRSAIPTGRSGEDDGNVPEIDAASVVDAFLACGAESVELENAGDAERDADDLDDVAIRVAYLADIALQYYLSQYRSWIEAYFVASDEIPALCLAIPGSPIEYADSKAADEAAKMLGYESYGNMVSVCQKIFFEFPFLKTFAEDTLSFAADNWFEDMSIVDPRDYAIAVGSEIRANWPGGKSMADKYYEIILDDGDEFIDGKSGEGEDEFIVIGVKSLDENYMPASLASCDIEQWEGVEKSFIEYVQKKKAEFEEGSEEVVIPDQDIMALVYLQGYVWTNRSWNKIPELLASYVNDCFTFCWGCLSNEFVALDLEQIDEHAQELDTLAETLKNENGEVELVQVAPGRPDDLSLLNAPSRRFVELMQEQEQADLVMRANEGITHVIEVMSGRNQTVTDMFVDEIMSCVYAMSDLTDQEDQIECLRLIRDATLRSFDSKERQYKSRWKKYLDGNREASEAIKNACPIVDMDDNGDPVFDS